MNSIEILEGLDEEITMWKQNLQQLTSKKDEQIKVFKKILQQTEQFYSGFVPNVCKPKPRFKLDESLKTIRKMQLFGISNWKTDFEWSIKDEIKALPETHAIKLCGFNWKECKYEGYGKFACISALQLLFSNGMKSPLFLAKNIRGDYLQKVDFDQ